MEWHGSEYGDGNSGRHYLLVSIIKQLWESDEVIREKDPRLLKRLSQRFPILVQ